MIKVYWWLWYGLAVAMGTASLFVMIVWIAGMALRALGGD